MNKLVFTISLFLSLNLAAFQIPELTGPVMDQAQILSGSARAQLTQLLLQLNQSGKAQIQVFTIPSLEGQAIEELSIKVVDKWKLGTAKGDNGILFLVAVQDRRMRIEVGQGLEGDLPDAIASRIVREVVTPFFKAQRYSDGVIAGVQAIIDRVAPDFATGDRPELKSGQVGLSKLAILIIIIIVISIISRFGGGGRRGFGGGIGGGYLGGGGFGGFGGGGGGGGWSGGGGGFSGGGSSGNW